MPADLRGNEVRQAVPPERITGSNRRSSRYADCQVLETETPDVPTSYPIRRERHRKVAKLRSIQINTGRSGSQRAGAKAPVVARVHADGFPKDSCSVGSTAPVDESQNGLYRQVRLPEILRHLLGSDRRQMAIGGVPNAAANTAPR